MSKDDHKQGILNLMRMRLEKLEGRIVKLQRRRERLAREYAEQRAEMLNPQHRPQLAAAGDCGD